MFENNVVSVAAIRRLGLRPMITTANVFFPFNLCWFFTDTT